MTRVLFEKDGFARTPQFAEVKLPLCGAPPGSLANVRLTSVTAARQLVGAPL